MQISINAPPVLSWDICERAHFYNRNQPCQVLYCRYRFGDVIRVVRLHNKTPVIEFMYRQGQLLNLRHEKITEDMLLSAVQSSIQRVCPTVPLQDYTSCEVLPSAGGEKVRHV